MSRTDWPSLKRPLMVMLSTWLALLGVACMGWALYNIEARATDSFEPYVAPASGAATRTLEHLETTVGVSVPYPKKGERIGTLSIPALKQRMPIIEGTDDPQLDRGVGHFIRSVLPGQADNCVLSGHRDTVFTGLGKLNVGDELVVQTATGTYTYEITRIRIVDKDDKTVIVPSDHATLTLSTCYPFNYVGFAPDRYILAGDLVRSE